MARDGLFFERLARLHPRYQTPAFAVVTSSIWAALLAVTGTYEQLLTYVVFAAWFFYAFGGIAVFHYRRDASGRPSSVRGAGLSRHAHPVHPVRHRHRR